MEEKIKALKEQMEAALGSVDSKEQLAEFWQNFLGKKGSIADLMKGLGSVPKEERPNVGKTINEFKNQVEARYQEMKNKMDELELAARNKSEQVDITMPAKMRPAGGLHPLTVTENEMIDVFAGMGFEIYDGPEIEDDDHNFTRLNVAKNHPDVYKRQAFRRGCPQRLCRRDEIFRRDPAWNRRSCAGLFRRCEGGTCGFRDR